MRRNEDIRIIKLIFFSIWKILFNTYKKILSKLDLFKDYLKGYTYKADIDNIKYVNLAPVDKIEESDTYFNALDWAIEDEKIKNIALTGPYGAGKSSIIQSYLKERPHLNYLNISLASFCEAENGLVDAKLDKIEEGILKQLFYKVNYKKIPHSRYRKIHNLRYKNVLTSIVVLSTIGMVLFAIFRPLNLLGIKNIILNAATSFNISKKVVLIGLVGTVSLLIIIVSYILWLIMIKFTVVKVNVLQNTEMKSKEITDSDIFNKNLDEILYFFENSKYEVVFIEDLDRFQNAEIFIKLRELNNLLNNYEMIKRRIIFIYAIKDDMFTKEDRTKFFDFIIPAIPIINSTNSGEKVLKKIQGDNIDAKLSDSFINTISVYIEDMRLLNNVFNEFLVFKSILMDIEGLRDDEMMFTLMIFKNLYPEDFADLQFEKGIVKAAFDDKKRFLMKCKKEFSDKRKEYEEILVSINKDHLKSLEELKQVLLYDLVGKQCIVSKIDIYEGNSYYKDKTIEYNNYITNEFDINQFGENRLKVYYRDYNGYTDYKDTYLNEADKRASYKKGYIERFNYLKYNTEDKKKDIINKIELLRLEEYKLQSYKLVDLLKKYDPKEIFSDKVLKNKFLVFTLRNGYLNEYYANYINYFHPNSITKSDMNFIMSVRNHEPLDFDYEISKVKQVVDRLEVYEFEQKEVYNFNLLDYMLQDINNTEKCEVYIKQLSDGKEKSCSFIDEFINITGNIDKFTKLICNNWSGIWKWIENTISFSDERKYRYLINILRYADIEDINQIEKDSNLREFIINTPNILQVLSEIGDDRLIEVLEEIKIYFVVLNCNGVSNKVLDFIFDNSYYVISEEMIEAIVKYKYPSKVDKLRIENYSTILSTGYDSLIKKVNDNLEEYVENVLLEIDTNTNESMENIEVLLDELISNRKLCEQIIDKQMFIVTDINRICNVKIEGEFKENVNAVWDQILELSKVSITWETVFAYYYKWGITDILLSYIDTHINVLKEKEIVNINEENKFRFMKEILISSLGSKAYKVLANMISVNMEEVELSDIRRDNMEMLIKIKYVPFNRKFYSLIKEEFDVLNIEYLCENKDDYMQDLDEYMLDITDLIKLLEKNTFTQLEKIKIVESYGISNITSDVANLIYRYTVKISKELTEVLWDKVNDDSRYELLYNQLNVYTNVELSEKFKELGGEYSQLAINSKNAKLRKSVYNEKLAEALKSKEYISSFEAKSINKKDILKIGDEQEILVLRVKKAFR